MFLSPPQRVVKHTLVGRILLCIPVTIYFLVLGILSLDPEPVPTLAWVIGGVALALTVWGCIAIGKNQVSIHSEGVQQDGPFGSRAIRWEDVTETRYRRTQSVNTGAHFGLLGWLIYALASRGNAGDGGQESLTVISSDGAKVKLTSNYKGVEFAIGDVHRAVNMRLLEDARRRVRQGETVVFGNVGVSSAGVSWKGKAPISYAEIVSIELEAGNLKVKQQGKWIAPVSVAAQKVPNVFVALDLMKELKYGPNQPQPAFLQAAQVKF
jgi:hypothetical protein